jgi:hypothetical protein
MKILLVNPDHLKSFKVNENFFDPGPLVPEISKRISSKFSNILV